MSENKKQRDPIPESFSSIEEAGEFWDTHSLADYWDLTHEVEIEVDLKSSTHVVAIEKGIAREVRKLARGQGLSPETLINLWLQEKIQEAAKEQQIPAAS
ncbi:MAG: CopG family antitoxin [Candidatus Poribacteria bacterium]